MNPIIHKYKFVKQYRHRFIGNKEIAYNGFSCNDIIIRESENNLKLKIRLKNKYPFTRIYFKLTIENIWHSKFPDSEDLIILQKIHKQYKILIYKNHWSYRFLFLSNLESNPNELNNKMI